MNNEDARPPSSSEQTVTVESRNESTVPSHQHRGHWNSAQDWFGRRRSSGGTSQYPHTPPFQRTRSGKRWWKFTLRPWDDDEYQDWWFASTAIPLLAATIGPLANVFSIAALVTFWRMCLLPDIAKDNAEQCLWDGRGPIGPDLEGQPFRDPNWCYNLNVVSLTVGFVGNFFLLCNFTGRIRYIIALPVTIIMWYIATGILIGITVSMEINVPPIRPQQTYTQGFWYAVIAACMYLTCSMLLMVNMLGYFLGLLPPAFRSHGIATYIDSADHAVLCLACWWRCRVFHS